MRVPIVWPHKGISERYGFTQQPPLSARAGQNVVNMTPASGRLRGGQRAGLERYIDAQVNGANPPLDLGIVVGDDRLTTYAELDEDDFEHIWRKPEPSLSTTQLLQDQVVDTSGRVYVADRKGFHVYSPDSGDILDTVIAESADINFSTIEVDAFFNVYYCALRSTASNSRIYKYRPLVTGGYKLDWELAVRMQTTGLGAGATIGTVTTPAKMELVGGSLWVLGLDNSSGEAEVHRYDNPASSAAPSGPSVAYGVPGGSNWLAIRPTDGDALVASDSGVVTRYDQDGNQIWQVTLTDDIELVLLDSSQNFYAVEGSGGGTTITVYYYLDDGSSSPIQKWSSTPISGVVSNLFSSTGMGRGVVDQNDTLYVPISSNTSLVAAYAVDGALIFSWPDDTVTSSGFMAAVGVPPTLPDYGSDPVRLAEFLYYAQSSLGNHAITSSTDTAPIVLTVADDLTSWIQTGDTIAVFNHLTNTNANGFQGVGAITSSTIELAGSTATGGGAGSGGTLQLQGAIGKMRMVSATPLSGSTRTAKVLAVAGGAIKVANPSGGTWDDPSGGGSSSASPALSAASEYVSSVDIFSQRFFTDGVGYAVYDLATDTVLPYKATKGSIEPRCKLIAAWNGRLVVARSPDDPHGWFMSRSGDPYDYEYFPRTGEVDPTTAAAGFNTDAGRVPDIINGLIPWNDQLLFFMGDRSVWRMTGDPMDNGRIDNVSQTIGMAFGSAWARDARGLIYFFSSEAGVYRMAPNSAPERISVGWIEERLRDVNLTARFAKLSWNYVRDGLDIFITARDGAGGTRQEHYFWEGLTGSWWPVTYATTDLEPTAVMVLDGDAPEDRVRLTAHEDGYVRTQADDSRDDDGIAIHSYVIMGPFTLPSAERALRLLHAQITLATELPGGAYWKLYATDRADVLGPPVRQGHLSPGRSPRIQEMRCKGQYFFLELGNSAPGCSWAFEDGLLNFAGAGRTRSDY